MVDHLKELVQDLRLSGIKQEEFFIIDIDGKIHDEILDMAREAGATSISYTHNHVMDRMDVTSFRLFGRTFHLLKKKRFDKAETKEDRRAGNFLADLGS